MSQQTGPSDRLFKEICLFKIYYPEKSTEEAVDIMNEGMKRVSDWFSQSPAYSVKAGPFIFFRQLRVRFNENQDFRSYQRIDKPLTVATLSFRNVLTENYWSNRSLVIPDNNLTHCVLLSDILSSSPLTDAPQGDGSSPQQRSWAPNGLLITPASPRQLASFHLVALPAEKAVTGALTPPCIYLQVLWPVSQFTKVQTSIDATKDAMNNIIH